MMTIREAIDALLRVPSEHWDLPLYIWDGEDNLPCLAITLFDSDEKHGPDNPLAVDLDYH